MLKPPALPEDTFTAIRAIKPLLVLLMSGLLILADIIHEGLKAPSFLSRQESTLESMVSPEFLSRRESQPPVAGFVNNPG